MKASGAIAKISVFILALAAAHAVLSLRQDAQSRIVRKTSLSPAADGADAINIVRDGAQTIALTNGGAWRIERPIRADADAVRIAKLTDALAFGKIDDTLSDTELAKLGIDRDGFDLDVPRLTVETFKNGKAEKIFFGRATPAGKGVYAAVEGEPFVYVVDREIFEAADVQLDGLRRKKILNISADEISGMDIRLGTGRFVRLEAGQIQNDLLDKVLAAEAKEFVWPLGETEEAPVASVALLAGYGLDPDNAANVILRGIDGADRTIGIGSDAGEGLVYALTPGAAAVVKIDSAIRDALFAAGAAKEESRLFAETGDIQAVSLAWGGTKILLKKNSDGTWMLESPVSGPADSEFAGKICANIANLKENDVDENGVDVSVSTNIAPVRVAYGAVLGTRTLDALRSLEMIAIKRSDVKRLSSGGNAVVFNAERKVWMADGASGAIGSSRPADGGRVSEKNIENILGMLESLKAVKVADLASDDAELSRYGLDEPEYRLSVDVATSGVPRRNILIGADAPGGKYATVGANDAVFVISRETADVLMGALIECERKDDGK